MPTREELMIALKKADAAGDEAGAQRIARMIKEQRGNSALSVRPAQPQARTSPNDTMARADQAVQQIDQMSRSGIQADIQSNPAKQGSRAYVGTGADGAPYRAEGPIDPMSVKTDPFVQALQDSETSFERGAAMLNGASFSLGDEIAGFMGDKYGKQGMRDNLASAREKRPIETMLIEGISAAPGGGAGAQAFRRATGAARTAPGIGGATGGAVYGFGDAEGGLVERLDDAAIGAAAGGIAGKTLEKPLSIGAALKRQKSGVKTDGAIAQDEFGVRMSRGQSTGDFDEIAFEQAAARGGKTPEAQQITRPFFEDQKEAVKAAGRNLAGDKFSEVNEAGAFVSDGIKRKAGQAQNEIKQLYAEAEQYGAQMRAEGVTAMPKAVRDALPDEIKFLMDAPSDQARQTMPAAMQAMGAVDRLKQEVTRKSGQGQGRVTALDFRRIETARRAINASIGSAKDPTDKRAAVAVKNAFDGYIDGAVDAALFEGDEAFLTAYQRARGARADFARKFEANRVFEKLVRDDASPEQTLEYILGSTKIAPVDRVRKVIPQLKTALGEGSQEWAALQEAAMMRMMKQTEKTYNPKVLRDNLDELLVGRNQTVAQELFSAEQYARLRRFRGVVERLIPPDGAVNTSGTAYEIQRQLTNEASKIFDFPGGRTLLSAANKYLPFEGRDALRARRAVSEASSRAAPQTVLPDSFVPVAAVGGDRAADQVLQGIGYDNR